MNVKERTINALYELIDESYQMNRLLDRMVSVLSVDFVCNNVSELVHLHISHLFPKLADEIGEKCLERYNISVKYSSTDSGMQKYSSVLEIMKVLMDRTIQYQNMFMGTIKIASEESDYQVVADLLDIIEDYNKVVEQTILLYDKCEAYGDNLMSFDAHIKEHFWILGD